MLPVWPGSVQPMPTQPAESRFDVPGRSLRRLGPWWAVFVVVVIGMTISALGALRLGGYVVSGGLALGALLRGLEPRPGGLEVRRAWVDVGCWLGLAVAVGIAFSLVRLDPTP